MEHRKTQKKIRWKSILPFYVFALPGFIYLLINNYLPMFGIVIAFKKLDFSKGILKSPWNGLNNFRFLFMTKDAWIITRNTVGYNIIFFIVGSIFAIALAILLNEIRSAAAKKFYQTIILLPYLMSWVVVGYLAYAYLAPGTGLFNVISQKAGWKPVSFYQDKTWWPFILTFVNLWKGVGYSMIVYLSSIISISPDYYEAARIDGATKWQCITNITLPLIRPTFITLFILSVGQVFRSDFGLFYQVPRNSGLLYPVTRTIDVYVYQALMVNSDFAMSSAAGVYQSICGFILIIAANMIVRKYQKSAALF